MNSLRSLQIGCLAAAMIITAAAHAADHVIALSAPWPSAAELAPGDRILLEPGLHDARAIEDWPGTFGMPIVITSQDESIPAGIVGLDSPAVVARDCGGLHFERILIVGDGLDLAGRGRDSDSGVTLRNVQFLPRSREAAAPGPAFGVRIADTGRTVIEGMGVQRWREAGITLDRVGESEIRGAGLAGGIDSPVGIVIRDCRRTWISGGGIVGGTKAGVLISSTATADSQPSTEVRLEAMVFQQNATPVRIEGTAALEMSRCTVVAPSVAVVEVSAGAEATAPAAEEVPSTRPASARINLDRCLTVWTTGRLAQLFKTPTGGPTPTIRLGRNLWWSPELAANRDAVGGFPDAPERQRTDLDPRLVPRTWLPSAAPATAFGHGSPKTPSGSDGE